MIRKLGLVVALFCAPHLFPPTLESASPPTKVVVISASLSEKLAAYFVAQDQNLFRKYDLDVQLVLVRTGPVALSSMIAGEAQFFATASTAPIMAAIAGGLDLVFAAGLVNKLDGTFVVSPGIKGPAELKGKTVGVASIGGGVWMVTMLVFERWGLSPVRDGITLRNMGAGSETLARALLTGTIDAAYMNKTHALMLKKQGFHIMADLPQLGIPYLGTGVLTRRSFVAQSPATVEKVLRALLDAMDFIREPKNKPAVVKSLARGLRLDSLQHASDGYESMLELYDRRIYPNTEGIQNVIRLLGTVNEKIRPLRAEDLVDDRIVKKLEKDGRF
jgi:ABC-type nitrate/sulfonate/bicarbonate transport system substrate-binding protein